MKIVKRDYEKLIGEAVKSFGLHKDKEKDGVLILIQELEEDYADMKMWKDVLQLRGKLDEVCEKGMHQVDELRYHFDGRFQTLARVHTYAVEESGNMDMFTMIEVMKGADVIFGYVHTSCTRCIEEVRDRMYAKLQEV